jgi:hypothetical protein
MEVSLLRSQSAEGVILKCAALQVALYATQALNVLSRLNAVLNSLLLQFLSVMLMLAVGTMTLHASCHLIPIHVLKARVKMALDVPILGKESSPIWTVLIMLIVCVMKSEICTPGITASFCVLMERLHVVILHMILQEIISSFQMYPHLIMYAVPLIKNVLNSPLNLPLCTQRVCIKIDQLLAIQILA